MSPGNLTHPHSATAQNKSSMKLFLRHTHAVKVKAQIPHNTIAIIATGGTEFFIPKYSPAPSAVIEITVLNT